MTRTGVSTLSHRSRWGRWWRWPPRVEHCAGCGSVAACWWIDGRRGGVQWRCVQCLPHLVTYQGRKYHDPANRFAPRDWTEAQVLAHVAALVQEE